LPPVFERPEYVGRIVNALAQEGREGLLLVGEPGVGKRFLVHALAQLIARGAPVPPSPPILGGVDVPPSSPIPPGRHDVPPSPPIPGGAPAAPHPEPPVAGPAPAGGAQSGTPDVPPPAPVAQPPTPTPQPPPPPWLPASIWALQPAALLQGVEAGVQAALA